MNLENLLDYGNSIYKISEKINNIKRKTVKEKTRTMASTALKMLMCMFATGTSSINSLECKIKNEKTGFKNIFAPREFIPKTHAWRDCVKDTDYEDVRKMHMSVIEMMKNNKVFENHTYRGSKIGIIDGVELFETKKCIDGLHIRNYKDGTTGYYYKALGIMYLADDVEIMLDAIPFEKNEVEEDTEHNKTVKSEGEITVFKRTIKELNNYTNGIDIVVADCMFLNAPCMNHAKDENIDMIAKLTDERRDLYKDSSKLFSTQEAHQKYEIVKVIENKKVKYSKQSKKKNTEESKTYYITRAISGKELNEKIIVQDKKVEHPKKTVTTKITETVIKIVEVWADNFDMNGYEYGQVKVLKVRETTGKGENDINEMYIVTTLLDEDLEFIVDLMHKRWNIELKGFRTLKTRYHMDHLFIGDNDAIKLITYVLLIVYNLISLYFNIHTSKYRGKINFKELLNDYLYDIKNNKKIYLYFLKE